MKKKRGLKALSLVLLVFLLSSMIAGCAGLVTPPAESLKQGQEESSGTNVQTQATTKSDVPENLNSEGFPIVKEPITLKGFGEKNTTHGDWKDMLVFQEMEKLTNIKIEWNTPPVQGFQEKKNILLASGDIPDIFFRAKLSTKDEIMYGTQGVLIPLNDLIDKYAPNIKARFAEYPEIKKSITQPDGNIYSLPQVTDSISARVRKLWINQKWLDNLNMEVPTTIDEFYQVLKAFRDNDPNGNGLKDEIPYSDTGKGGPTFNWLANAWGLGNRGVANVTPPFVDLGPDGKVRFYPIDPRFKEVLEFMNKMYKEGLIDSMVFVLERPEFVSKGDQGIIGVFGNEKSNTQIGQKHASDYVVVPALKGPHGDQLWGPVQGTVQTTGTFAITNVCKYPEAAIRWVDYLYSEEGSKLLRWGLEGLSYTVLPDGTVQLSDDLVNNPEGLNFAQAMGRQSPYPGGNVPHFIFEKIEKLTESDPAAVMGNDMLKPFFPEEVWQFTFTPEEQDQLTALQSDIHTYINEMRVKFVTGDEPLSNWDNYVNTIKRMGLEDLMRIYESAYERWKK